MTRDNPSLIHIEISTAFLDSQSDAAADRYAFSYTITIRNDGALGAKLVSRHWIITDANGRVQEVRGKGVVGQQPFLRPGEGFQYTSGTVLETPIGTMEGSYQMEGEDGSAFDAPIPLFSLAMPGSLH